MTTGSGNPDGGPAPRQLPQVQSDAPVGRSRPANPFPPPHVRRVVFRRSPTRECHPFVAPDGRVRSADRDSCD